MRAFESTLFSEKSTPFWVSFFIVLHVFLWTLAPSIVRLCLPMDALEGATWGQQLEWGYDKNPFMNAWVTALAVKLSDSKDWVIYFFSQLSVAVCFWSVWSLGKRMVAPVLALLSILLLACTQYYNLHAIDLNDNTLELGLWGLSVLYFYRALHDGRLTDWILLGVFTSLSLMTKYFVVVLLVPMFLFMLLFPNTRAQFKKPFLYFGLVVFLVISVPHFVWLVQHDFITLQYAFNRVSAEPQWSNHLFYPLQFIWQQFEVFLPAAVLLGLLWWRNPRGIRESSTTSFNKFFILFMGVGPLLTTALLSALTGMKLRAGWGQPLLTFLPLCLLVWFAPVLTVARVRAVLLLSLSVMLTLLIGYCVAIVKADSPSSANFPGKFISQSLEQTWQKQFHTPLKYVVGARWITGNVSYYSYDKPYVFIDADPHVSPWIDEKELLKNGALFLWDPTEQHEMRWEEVKKRYPRLGPVEIMHFSWLRNPKMEPIEMRVAILPPESV